MFGLPTAGNTFLTNYPSLRRARNFFTSEESSSGDHEANSLSVSGLYGPFLISKITVSGAWAIMPCQTPGSISMRGDVVVR